MRFAEVACLAKTFVSMLAVKASLFCKHRPPGMAR
jgi:hypothetical protein